MRKGSLIVGIINVNEFPATDQFPTANVSVVSLNNKALDVRRAQGGQDSATKELFTPYRTAVQTLRVLRLIYHQCGLYHLHSHLLRVYSEFPCR